MFDEDGRKIDIRQFPANMENYSVSDIAHYITELEQEIERCKSEMAKKKASQDEAASIFKS